MKTCYTKLKFILLAFLLPVSCICTAQKSEPGFKVYFGNDFENDSVSIFINAVQVADNIKLTPTMISPKNLIIIQDDHNIVMEPHHKLKQVFKKIPVKDSILNMRISMNKIWSNFTFNLKDGRYFFPEYTWFRVGWSVLKVFTIKQSKEGVIMW